MSETKSEAKAQIPFRATGARKQELKQIALDRHTTVQTLIERSLEAYLNTTSPTTVIEHEPENKKENLRFPEEIECYDNLRAILSQGKPVHILMLREFLAFYRSRVESDNNSGPEPVPASHKELDRPAGRAEARGVVSGKGTKRKSARHGGG